MRGVEVLPGARPLPLTQEARWLLFSHRRLRLGGAEEAIVQALVHQRERYCQTGGQVPLCLSLPLLAAHLGLPQEKPKNLQRIISRVNPKLAAHGWTIAWLQSGAGARGYALFCTSEVLTG